MKPVLGFCLCQAQVILMVGDFLSRLPPSPCLQSVDLSSVSVTTLPRLSGILDFLSSIVISGCPNLLFNLTVQIHSFHSLRALSFLYPQWEGPAKHHGLSVCHVLVPLVRRVPEGRVSADSVPPRVDESGEGSSLISAQLSPRELNAGGSSSCKLYVASSSPYPVCSWHVVGESNMGFTWQGE